MRSDDEKYLDSLLNSAQSNNDPKSALSRMSTKAKTDVDTLGSGLNGSGDIGELVNNSNGNQDLNEIGDVLSRFDRDEVLNDQMANLLDGIETPTDSSVPQFSVGNSISSLAMRDPEEIALDEAIADAEKMNDEYQSGKFDAEPSAEPAEAAPVEEVAPAPIVDLEGGDDALLEMAPEEILPEDNAVAIDNITSSDAGESPEEILTDLLDDMPGDSLTVVPDESVQDSLSDALDNIQEASDDIAETLEGIDGDVPADGGDSGIGNLEELDNLDDLSLDDIEKAMDGMGLEEGEGDTASEEMAIPEAEEMAIPESEESAAAPDGIELSEEALSEASVPEESLEELSLDQFTLDGGAGEELSLEEPEASEGASEDAAVGEGTSDEISLDELSLDPSEGGEMESMEESSADASSADGEGSGDDEIDLSAMEASLDDLLGEDVNLDESLDGEVAEIAAAEGASAATGEEGGGEGDVSIPDLDALMNSLANDEIEDIESTAAKDEEAGVAQEEELPKEEILEALTEEGFDDGAAEPSLDDLAAIPERKGGGGGAGDEDEGGKKGKKEKKGQKGLAGLLSKLFHTLTDEDEENEGLASLTDENQTVLNELAGDEKPKKEKKKKEKKPKKEKPPKEKKPKKEKPPKPKKEKKPKEPKDPGAPEKVMSPKKIAICGIFAASIGILFMIPVLVLPERIASQKAESAYTHREYTTAYKMLYGKEMTEDQTIIYEQSRVLAWAERYLSGYENYMAMNMKEEALDMLLMGMRNKSDLLEEAAKFNVEIQVQSVYDSIESLLSTNYGLSETDISEINSIKKERDYTIRLMEIVGTL